MPGDSFNVLMVCSGNLCRSAIAEQLLRQRMDGYPLQICSAGTIARDGDPMPEEAARISRRYGGDPGAHRSRLLTETHLQTADLVLTAAREHRSAVVKVLPRMSRRTFTITEFARLAGAIPEVERELLADPASMVDAARSLRGIVAPPEDPADDDLEDPYRRPFEVYEAVGARIHDSVGAIVAVLTKAIPAQDPRSTSQGAGRAQAFGGD